MILNLQDYRREVFHTCIFFLDMAQYLTFCLIISLCERSYVSCPITCIYDDLSKQEVNASLNETSLQKGSCISISNYLFNTMQW